jgi:uncharacterized protein YjiS (DUF1127 family)
MSRIRNDGFNSYGTVVRVFERARGHIRRGLRQWQARRTAIALEMLGDEGLRDIGITRAEIPAVARRVTAPESKATKRPPDSRATSAQEVTA